MLRPLYRCVLSLHPPAFRTRFADEMLSIFDHADGTHASLRLLLDALLSLARQWTLRPEFWHDSAPAPQPALDGIPSFQSIEPFRPRTAAVINSLVLSMAVFCLTCFAIKYGSIHLLYVRIPEIEWESTPPISSNSATGASRIPDGPSAPSAPQHQSPVTVSPVPGPRFKTSDAAPAMATREPVAEPSAQAGSETSGAATPASERQGAFAPAPQGSSSTTALAAPPPQAYVGTYVSAPPEPLTISITVDGGRLRMEIAGERQGTLSPVSDTKFVVLGVENRWIEFAPDGDGVIRHLTLSRNGRRITAQRH